MAGEAGEAPASQLERDLLDSDRAFRSTFAHPSHRYRDALAELKRQLAPLVQALEGILRVQKSAAEAEEGAAARKALARYQSKRDDAAQAVEGALAAAPEAHVPAADGGDSCDDMAGTVAEVAARARTLCPSHSAPSAVTEEDAGQLRVLAREGTRLVQAAHRQAVLDAKKAAHGAASQ